MSRNANVPENVPAAGQSQAKTTLRRPTSKRKPPGKSATYRGALCHPHDQKSDALSY